MPNLSIKSISSLCLIYNLRRLLLFWFIVVSFKAGWEILWLDYMFLTGVLLYAVLCRAFAVKKPSVFLGRWWWIKSHAKCHIILHCGNLTMTTADTSLIRMGLKPNFMIFHTSKLHVILQADMHQSYYLIFKKYISIIKAADLSQ